MQDPTVKVDYYHGFRSSSTAEQKWFYCWHDLLRDRISTKFIFAHQKYLPHRVIGLRGNAGLQSFEVYFKRRTGSILHIPTQLLADTVTARWARNGAVVITCHDVIPYLPNAYELTGISYPSRMIDQQVRGLQMADAIITDSENSRRDIIERLKIAPERVHVVYLGVDASHYRPRPEEQGIRQRYGFADDHFNILYVGSEAPRKNLKGIAQAMAILRQRGVQVQLIKVGAVETWGDEFRALVQKLKLNNDIIYHTHVPEDILPSLYNLADMFLFPSFYEGFGMPVLEAMASGCPVITSTTTSLQELGAGATMLVDPSKAEQIADAIEQLAASAPLREQLIQAGLERVHQFSWNKTADQTLKIYHQLAAGSRGSRKSS